MKLKPRYYKFLLKALIGIVLSFTLLTTYRAATSENEIAPTRIIQHDGQISNSEYIISKELILGKLQSKSEIVSVEQEINKTDTKVDDGFFGTRSTEMNVSGTYKMGISVENIHITYIDNDSKTVYIELGKPELISLEIPYSEVDVEKVSGWLRLSMSEEETKNFYKTVHSNIKKEILNDKEIMSQANLNNQRVIKELIINLPGVEQIVFSEVLR